VFFFVQRHHKGMVSTKPWLFYTAAGTNGAEKTTLFFALVESGFQYISYYFFSSVLSPLALKSAANRN